VNEIGLHMDIHTFTYQLCEGGHLIYSHSGNFSGSHCSICGSKFLTKCPQCSTPVGGSFRSSVYFTTGEPAHPPHIPGACTKCGTTFPWTRNKALHAHLSEIEAVELTVRCCSRFHHVTRQLRERYNDRQTLDIADEYDVQDLLHALLVVHFDDIRREEWTPSYAGSSARVDFLLKPYGIVVEAKMTRKGLGVKQLGTQLTLDIAHYKQMGDCRTLVCFIYDPEDRITNASGLVSDLEGLDKDISVRVVIAPNR